MEVYGPCQRCGEPRTAVRTETSAGVLVELVCPECEVADRIDAWHNGGSGELHEYLGWTWEQYAHWVQTNERPSQGAR